MEKDETVMIEEVITEQERKALEQISREIRKLLLQKKAKLASIKKHREAINNDQQDIKEINESLCRLQGHTYENAPWREKTEKKDLGDYVLKHRYFIRNCEVCGFPEVSQTVPKEYIEMTKIKR